MEIFTAVITFICMAVYTIYAVWQINQFCKLSTGITGTAALFAGGAAVYFLAPIIAMLIALIFKLCVVILVIYIIICIFSG